MMIAWKKLCQKLVAFGANRRGNVAITFAFAAIPVIALVGAAIDYSRANQLKAAMQTAVDGTALMLSKEASTDTTDILKQNALKYFVQMLNRPDIDQTAITVNVTYNTTGGPNIVIDATAQLPAQFVQVLKLIGSNFDTFTVKASSTSKWGITRLRVALVLDNTGSMADNGKMTALQGATVNLLNQLKGAVTTNGDVYVSIIPFVKDVNVGATYYNADWVYWGNATQDPNFTDDASWDANNGTCQSGSWNTRSKCWANVGNCSNSTYTTQSTCTGHGDCSVGGTTSQSTCASSGTCSISGNTTQTQCNSAGTCSLSGYTTQNSCTGAGTCSISGYTSQNSCTSAGTCSKPQYTSRNQCRNNGGTWTNGQWTSTPGTWTAATWTPATFTPFVWTHGTWTAKNHNIWNGCVMDRGYPMSPSNLGGQSGPDTTYNYDTNSVSPDPVTPRMSSLYPAEQYSSCPQAVMGLSYDWTSMTNLVNNMSPAGNTNQALGLQLGWMSLVGGGPFTVPPLDPLYQYTQVIILLTDGLNTQDRWYSSQNSIDTREQLTCQNINNAGVQLYTIQVNTSGDPTSTLLQNCATNSSMFYLLTTADQITATFQQIGTNLTKLRVAN